MGWLLSLVVACAMLGAHGSLGRVLLSQGRLSRSTPPHGRVHFEPGGFEMLKRLGFRPSNVLDIGANKGSWTRDHMEQFPLAKFFMIDGADNHKQWQDLMGNRRVNTTVAILSDKEHDVDWFEVGSSPGNSMFHERTQWFDGVPAKVRHSQTLDGLLRRNGWNHRFELVKVDVQGAELAVLRGAPEVLKNAEVLLMEMPFLGQYNVGAPAFPEYIAFLDKAGFVPFEVEEMHRVSNKGSGYLFQIDFIFVRKGSSYEKEAQKSIETWGTLYEKEAQRTS